MGRCKVLSDFDKGQIVMARHLGWNISLKWQDLWGGLGKVSAYQQWSEERQATEQCLIDAQGLLGLYHLVRTDRSRRKCYGYWRNVSQHTMHRILWRMELRSCRLVRVPVRVIMCWLIIVNACLIKQNSFLQTILGSAAPDRAIRCTVRRGCRVHTIHTIPRYPQKTAIGIRGCLP